MHTTLTGRLRSAPTSLTPRTQAFRIIWNGEGVGGLYKGMAAQIFKTVLAAALMLMIKEKVGEGTSAVMEAVQKSVAERKGGMQTKSRGFRKGLGGKIIEPPVASAGSGPGSGSGLGLDSGLVSGLASSSGVGSSGGGLRQRLGEEMGSGVRGGLEATGGAVSALM